MKSNWIVALLALVCLSGIVMAEPTAQAVQSAEQAVVQNVAQVNPEDVVGGTMYDGLACAATLQELHVVECSQSSAPTCPGLYYLYPERWFCLVVQPTNLLWGCIADYDYTVYTCGCAWSGTMCSPTCDWTGSNLTFVCTGTRWPNGMIDYWND